LCSAPCSQPCFVFHLHGDLPMIVWQRQHAEPLA